MKGRGGGPVRVRTNPQSANALASLLCFFRMRWKVKKKWDSQQSEFTVKTPSSASQGR